MNGKLLDTNVIIRYIKDEDNLDDIFEHLTVVTADKHFSFIKGITTENR